MLLVLAFLGVAGPGDGEGVLLMVGVWLFVVGCLWLFVVVGGCWWLLLLLRCREGKGRGYVCACARARECVCMSAGVRPTLSGATLVFKAFVIAWSWDALARITHAVGVEKHTCAHNGAL